MKMTYAILSLVFTVFPASAQEKHTPAKEGEHHEACEGSTIDTTKFFRLAEQWRQAYNSKEANNLAPLYAEDAEYISSHVAGYIAHGREAVIANHQKGLDGGGSIESIEVLSVNTSCKLVTLVCRYVGQSAGKNVDGRNLIVLKKVDDKWLIATHMTVVQD